MARAWLEAVAQDYARTTIHLPEIAYFLYTLIASFGRFILWWGIDSTNAPLRGSVQQRLPLLSDTLVCSIALRKHIYELKMNLGVMQPCARNLRRQLLRRCVQSRISVASNFRPSSAWYSTPAFNIRKRLFDKSIPYDMVHMVDSETGQLGPSRALADVLAGIDKDELRVELIAEQPRPVVRIITRDFARQQKKDDKMRALRARRPQAERKQFQMTWGVNGNDLARKISRARGYLIKNHPVDFVLSKKKGIPLPSRDVMQWRMDDIVAALGDVSIESNRSIGPQLVTVRLRPLKVEGLGAVKQE